MIEITKELVLDMPDIELRKLVFEEDEEGHRYRERIWDRVNEIGGLIWLRERDLTINPDAVWKNRYTGDEFKLKDETFFVYDSNSDQTHSPKEFYAYFDNKAFLLWENNLPKDKWEGSNMFEKQQGKLNYMQDERQIKEDDDEPIEDGADVKPKVMQVQATLSGDKPIIKVLKCKVTESGFDVLNDKEFTEKDLGVNAYRIAHFPNKQTNEKIGVTKEEFEKAVKDCYKTNTVEWENITGKEHECFVDVLNHFNGDKQKADDYANSKVGNSKIKVSQIKLGETVEDLRARQLEESKCPICHELKPKEFDICRNEPNVEACLDCIRKRHEKNGLSGEGFTVNGELISFYSHTTEIETFNLKDFTRVFNGIMANSIFPYSVNLETTKTVTRTCYACKHTETKPEKQNHCFGVTKEFGEWLIKQGIKFEKEGGGGESMKEDEDEESEEENIKKKSDDDSQEEFEEEEDDL